MLAAAHLRRSDDELDAREQFERLLDAFPDAAGSEQVWERVRTWASVADSAITVRCQVLEVAGGHLVDERFPASVGLLAPLLRLVDSERYETLLAGELRGSATLIGEAASGSDGLVVLGAPTADVIAVVRDSEVQLVQPAGVRPAVGGDLTRRFGRIDIDACEPLGPAHPISDRGRRLWLAGARVAVAADMVGSARSVCDKTIEYSKERVQFGQAVASFQAVQHKLVDMAVLVETASAALDYAACCVDAESEDALKAAGVAKARAATAAIQSAISAVRLQGAVGLTWESDLHRHLRRAYASDQLFGSASRLRRELGRGMTGSHSV